MATKKASLQLTPALRKGIQEVRREVFGHVPQLHQRTGHQFAKKQLTAVYLNQYYIDPIEKFARKAIPGYMTELQERRDVKLKQLRRQGRGPPKKGAGARSQKKK